MQRVKMPLVMAPKFLGSCCHYLAQAYTELDCSIARHPSPAACRAARKVIVLVALVFLRWETPVGSWISRLHVMLSVTSNGAYMQETIAALHRSSACHGLEVKHVRSIIEVDTSLIVRSVITHGLLTLLHWH